MATLAIAGLQIDCHKVSPLRLESIRALDAENHYNTSLDQNPTPNLWSLKVAPSFGEVRVNTIWY